MSRSRIFPCLFRVCFKNQRSLCLAMTLTTLVFLVLSVKLRASLELNNISELTQMKLKSEDPYIGSHLRVRRDVNEYKMEEDTNNVINHDHRSYLAEYNKYLTNTENRNHAVTVSVLHKEQDSAEDIQMNQHTRLSSSLDPSTQNVHMNVSDSLWDPECEWVRFKRHSSPPYFLTAVLLVRIYESDKAKLTTRELKQWLQYLRFAGIEHVYVYDAWVEPSESQKEPLKKHIEEGYVTYIDWHTHNPYSVTNTQVAAYQDCIVKYGAEVTWTAAIDIDEYPFSPKDTRPGFLYRFVKQFTSYGSHINIVEITMQNFLFLGKPLDRELLIDRFWRRSHKPSNSLVKPIYQPKRVKAGIHHNQILDKRHFYSQNAPHNVLRMNHYWGARLQDWGEDTPEILAKTQLDKGIRPIVKTFKKCDSYLHSYIE